jgi:cyclase
MKTVRIIPCLDVDNGRVVKGVNFVDIRDAGDPVELSKLYNNQAADEITFLDIGATHKSREILLDVVESVSRQVFVPLSVGGGISSVEDMRRILEAGADKVSVCSAAIKKPDLLTEGAKIFGSQCIVLSIDAKKKGDSWTCYVSGGRIDSGIDALEWAKKGESLGAGEILLNSIDRDGTQIGYDLQLTRRVSELVNIPVIASGGAGNLEHMVEAVLKGKADAILLASLLHDRELSLPQIKEYLNKRGVSVRW